MTSDTNQKIRGLLLAALMVTSVFAGSIAFAGTAAAVNQISNGDINGQTSVSAYEETTATHTINFTATDVVENGNTKTIYVDFGSDYAGQVSVNSVDTNQSYSASNIAASNGNLSFTIQPPSNSATEVDVEFTIDADVTQPSVDGDQSYDVNARFESSGSAPTPATGTVATINVLDKDTSGTTADDRLDSGSRFWAGQTVSVADLKASTTYELRAINSDNNFVAGGTEFQSDSNGKALIDTSDLEAGSYVLVEAGNRNQAKSIDNGVLVGDAANDVASFSIAEQTLSIDFADDSVDQGDVSELEISSNRAGDVNATVEADGLSDGDLQDIFANFDAYENDDGDIELTINKGDSTDADFTGISAGDYQFNFSIADSTAEDSASIEVNKVSNKFSFVDNSVNVPRGDVATFNVSIGNSNSAGVEVGSTDAGFVVNGTLNDVNDDGYVEFEVNTYNNTVRATGDDTFALNNSDTPSSVLAASSYDVEVGPTDFYASSDTAQALGTLSVTDASTTGVQTWTASSETVSDISDAEDVAGAIENGTVTQDSTIANGDYVIAQVQATGIYGYVANQSGSTTTAKMLNASNLNITVEQLNPDPNRDAKVLDNSEATFIADEENGQFFVIVETGPEVENLERNGATAWEDGDEFNVSFEVEDNDGAKLDTLEDSVSTEFETVTREASLDTNADDVVEVEASENGTISGTSTVAPGSEIRIRTQSVSGADNPFVMTQTVNVSADGTFAATFDFSDKAVGTNFTVTAEDVSAVGFDDDVEADGMVVDQVGDSSTTEEPTTEEPTTEEPTTEQPTTEQPTTEQPTTEQPSEPSTTTTTSPGFGIAVALVALAGAALLALRREN